MKKLMFAVTLASCFGMSTFAQTSDRSPSLLVVEANSIQRSPADTALKPTQLLLSGNVVLTLPGGTRVTADSAVVPLYSNAIELNGGSVKIELPNTPTSIRQLTR